ncbi:hypothetical protein LLS1_30010 [Leifsonia sp. LS1]|uniref:hypothetical protein n=1 Tax=Leifsonia sp. LS1 TaxID=2828483 RepID=UPI001CFC5544|nr:hypothetical protein [Leifsonia sp. LS1]GIT81332.1 hypothetical protein LLS1_30010 [Leifsonia sp. LS1]
MIADDEHDTARSGGFDPRYDPAFQRGYRPQPGERPRTTVRSASGTAASGRVASGARTASPTSSARDVSPLDDIAAAGTADTSWEQSAEPVTGPAVAPYAAAPAVPAPSPLASVELSPRRNPYMLALWIVGAALVVLGVVVYAVAANTSYTNNYSGTGSDVATQVFIQIGWVLAGPMITIGFATLVALLFLTALTGRRRSSDVPPTDPDGETGL